MRTTLVLVLSSVLLAFSSAHSTAAERTIIAGTAKAIDGDTLSFGGLKVGLWGISAPEAKQACGKTKAGALAAKAMHDIANGKRVVCLDIPDDYAYMQPELVDLLHKRVPPHLR